jgi:branched-chain amino acid transport system substrate-binding protein
VPKALKVAKPGTEKFRAALRDAIEQTKGLKGSAAVFTMSPTDHSGVNQLGLAMLRIENGHWKLDTYSDYK